MSTPPTASAAFRADPDELRGTAARLSSVAASGSSLRPPPLHGADPQVDAAVDALTQKWCPALDTWTRSLGDLGRGLAHAAEAITGVDDTQAEAWSRIPSASARPRS